MALDQAWFVAGVAMVRWVRKYGMDRHSVAHVLIIHGATTLSRVATGLLNGQCIAGQSRGGSNSPGRDDDRASNRTATASMVRAVI
ncbi:hypothetical protein NL676_005374 [Syzygium grande]|nr:hypothetical protein NL676_005374 [Syzygium grande]